MAYFVKKEGEGLPLFTGTFSQVVKWCLKAQKTGMLQHHRYEIHGADLKREPVELVCEFYADDFAGDIV